MPDGAPARGGAPARLDVPAVDVAALLELAAGAGLSVAVAESLTAGAVCSALAGVAGASRVLRGGVVAYATELKASVLGVDAELLAARGPVDPDVAAAMAVGVRALLGARVGVATTGVAGPAPQGGANVGTVYVAVTWDDESHPPPEVEGVPVVVGRRRALVRHLALVGDRDAVRAGALAHALDLLHQGLRAQAAIGGGTREGVHAL